MGWQLLMALILVGSIAVKPVSCRDSLWLVDEGVLQQSEATTTLSLTHSVTIYQQPEDSVPRLQSPAERPERQRLSHQAADQSVGDFDWEAYLALNPDLPIQRYGSQEKAWQHYR